MTSLLESRQRRLDVGFLLGVVLAAGLASILASRYPELRLALFVAGVLAVLAARRPVVLAVLAVPAMFGFQTLGIGGGLGFSDAALIGAAVMALPALARTSSLAALAPLNRALLLYLALLLPSVILHESAAAGTEWVHRLVIVGGAGVVGAWLLHEQKVTPALQLLVAVAVLLALAAIRASVTTDFEPAFPLGYHKNYAGSMLAMTLIIVVCASHHVALPTPLRVPVSLVLVMGAFATQSRGALVGAALGLIVWFFAPRSGRTGGSGRYRLLAAVVVFGFLAYAYTSVQEQLNAENVGTSSVGVRRDVERVTRELWQSSPLNGVGIRYFTSGDFGPFAQPSNNAVTGELAESGLIGATGFVLLHGTVLVVLYRCRRTALGVTALALVSGRLLHGMFDIYWSSGITPMPFLVTGMALAESRRDRTPA